MPSVILLSADSVLVAI